MKTSCAICGTALDHSKVVARIPAGLTMTYQAECEGHRSLWEEDLYGVLASAHPGKLFDRAAALHFLSETKLNDGSKRRLLYNAGFLWASQGE